MIGLDLTGYKSLNFDGIDLKKLLINGVLVWEEPATYKNWVKFSTEADGVTIYNGGIGYKNGYRVRSGGAEGTTNRGSCTGFIPLKAGDTVRLSGYNALYGDAANAINVFNSSKENLGQVVANVADSGYGIFAIDSSYPSYGWASVTENPSGVYVWVCPPYDEIAFMRVTGYTLKDGSKMIVTVNQEIV
jgi:hypothetical protein